MNTNTFSHKEIVKVLTLLTNIVLVLKLSSMAITSLIAGNLVIFSVTITLAIIAIIGTFKLIIYYKNNSEEELTTEDIFTLALIAILVCDILIFGHLIPNYH